MNSTVGRPKKQSEKLEKLELYCNFANENFGGMNEKYIVVEPQDGVYLPAIVDKNEIVSLTTHDRFCKTALQYSHTQVKTKKYKLVAGELHEMYRHWLMLQPVIKFSAIKDVKWADEKGKSWARIPWDFDSDSAPTPLFDELISRVSNYEAFLLYVGSLFVSHSNRQQYLWIFGEGNNTKGQFIQFIMRCFGSGAHSLKEPSNGDRAFWVSQLVNKRLCVFPDFEDRTFVTTGLFKQLTGDEPINVNPKNKDMFTVKLRCKFMFASNKRPQLDSQTSNLRRIIFCKFDNYNGPEIDDYYRLLWSEGGDFLRKCVMKYLKEMPAGGPISSSEKAVIEIKSEANEDFDILFDKYFESVHTDTFVSKDDYIQAQELKSTMQINEQMTTRDYNEFINYLKREHGVYNSIISIGRTRRIRVYVGIKYSHRGKIDNKYCVKVHTEQNRDLKLKYLIEIEKGHVFQDDLREKIGRENPALSYADIDKFFEFLRREGFSDSTRFKDGIIGKVFIGVIMKIKTGSIKR